MGKGAKVVIKKKEIVRTKPYNSLPTFTEDQEEKAFQVVAGSDETLELHNDTNDPKWMTITSGIFSVLLLIAGLMCRFHLVQDNKHNYILAGNIFLALSGLMMLGPLSMVCWTLNNYMHRKPQNQPAAV